MNYNFGKQNQGSTGFMSKNSKMKIVLGTMLFGVVLSYIITSMSASIHAMDFYMQFFIVTVLLALVPAIIFSIAKEGHLNYKTIGGIVVMLIAFNLLASPTVIGVDGSLATTAGYNPDGTAMLNPDDGSAIMVPVTISTSSASYLFYNIWSGYASGIALFILLYPITFLLLTFGYVYLLTDKYLWDVVK